MESAASRRRLWPGGPAWAGAPAGRRLGQVRLSEFWVRMERQFGEGYARSIAGDHVLAALGGRTVNDALEAGVEAKEVWRAVCVAFDVPAKER